MGLLEAGKYERLMIDSVQVSDHKVEGEPKIVFRLTDPETQDSILDFLYTSNNAWDKVTAPRLKAYGWDPAENNYAIGQLHNNESLIGTEVGPVIVKLETWAVADGGDGKSRPKVQQVGEFIVKPADSAALTLAETKLRARLAPGARATRRTTPAKAAAPAKQAPPPPVDGPGDDAADVGF